MTMRIPLVTALWFLCAATALPTALSLSCYICQDSPGSTQPCSNPSVHACEFYYDSCVTIRTTVEYNGTPFTTTIKNCTASAVCHSSFICHQVSTNLVAANMKTSACSVSCCHGDLCNGDEAEPDGTGFTTDGSISTDYPTDDPSPTAEPDPMDYTTDGPIPTEYPTDNSGTKALSCYSCNDYPGSSQPCSSPSVIQCGNSQDSCMSTVVKTKMFGTSYTITVKNCSMSKYQCKSSAACAIMNKTLTGTSLKMIECSLSCCQGNLCNGPRGGDPTATLDPTGFNTTDVVIPTEYPTDDPTPKALSCYSCNDYPGSSQPCSNPSVNQCDSSQDSCLSTVVRTKMFGVSYTMTVRNCSMSKFECNSSAACAVLNKTLTGASLKMEECSLSCCQDNLCNGPSGGAEPDPTGFTTDGPTPTDHHTDDPGTKRCGAVSNNILTSPGYPEKYPRDLDCDYSVHIPHGMAMNITFVYFNVEGGRYSCPWDYLIIKNDNNQTFGTYCDTRTGHTVIVTGHYVKIFFHSDWAVTRKGYKLSFSAVPLGTLRPSTKQTTTYQPPGCGAVSNNILTSPGYPNNYPNNMNCTYSVDIPNGMAMKITFNYFNVEGLFDCKRRRFDYLIIKNENNQEFGEYCGYQFPGSSVIVTGRFVKLFFHSDGFVNKKGYNLSFTAVPLGTLRPSTKQTTTYQPPVTTPTQSQGCGAVSNNILTSPGYPNKYPNNMDCTYSVDIPRGMAMKITFHYFNLKGGSICWYDYLKIEYDNGQYYGKYCGRQSGMNVVVNGRNAVITFHSDSIGRAWGYKLLFSYFPLATLSPTPASSTNVPTSTAAPTTGTTGCPTAGPGSDPKSRLKCYIDNLQSLLDQTEQSLDNDLGSNSSLTQREHIERVIKAIANLDAVIKSAGRQKRDLSETVMVHHLKKKAADLITKLRSQHKRNTQLKPREKKHAAKGR